jgi:ubiquinone/menaquinone biosynthesis C-methylase UbiE
MKSEIRDFDKEAASWDEDPRRVSLANDIADAVSSEVVLTSDMDVLDFGCGTGLVTLRLQPFVRSVTCVDNSKGMLDVLGAKIERQGIANIKIRYADIGRGDALEGNYHLIVSSMTFHHIKEIGPLLDQFYKISAPGGYLCVADLDPDEGRFHENNEGVYHFGFERATLRDAFNSAGFMDVRDRTASEIIKPVPGGERRFSIFLMTGRKETMIDRGDCK